MKIVFLVQKERPF